MIISIIAFVIVIAVCVVVHEYGHYITAKILGVQVHEFAFGMGPLLLQHKGKNNMLWSLRLFPIGGFCRLAGMNEENDGETVIPGMGFNEQPAWKRFLILLNGSAFNIALAVILTALFLWGHGVLNMDGTQIGEVMSGFPAESAGLRVGDVITKVNGHDSAKWREMSELIRTEGTENPELTLTVKRNDETLTITVDVPNNEEYGRPMLGVSPSFVRYDFLTACRTSLSYTYRMSKMMLEGLAEFVLGRQEADITGPVGIASMSGQAMESGIWDFMTFIAIIALNLGLINLFPIPALDGGRILFVLLEIITRRRLPEKIEDWIHTAGFVLLISLMILITCKDVYTLFLTH